MNFADILLLASLCGIEEGVIYRSKALNTQTLGSFFLQSPIVGSQYEIVWKSLVGNATQLTACLGYFYSLGSERFNLTQKALILYLQRTVSCARVIDFHIYAIQLCFLFLPAEFILTHLHNTFHYGLSLDGSPSSSKRGAEAMRVYHIRLLCALLTQRQCINPLV